MNISTTCVALITIINYLTTEIICIPIALPQFRQQQQQQVSTDGFETGISAGISQTDADHDCFEAAVNGGVAANPEVGADAKFLGLSSGGIRCKQGNLKSILTLFSLVS